MQMFAKAMYQAWCDGQDERDICERYKAFISLASYHLCRDLEEMENFLLSQTWFVRPDVDCTDNLQRVKIDHKY